MSCRALTPPPRCLAHLSTAAADEFSGHLLDILKRVHAEGVAQVRHHAVHFVASAMAHSHFRLWAPQPHSLGLLRSDYMLNRGDGSARSHALLQVELNTISSSFGPLAQKVGDLHRWRRVPARAMHTATRSARNVG